MDTKNKKSTNDKGGASRKSKMVKEEVKSAKKSLTGKKSGNGKKSMTGKKSNATSKRESGISNKSK